MEKQEELSQIDRVAVLIGISNPKPVEYFEDYLSTVAQNPNNGVTVVSEGETGYTMVIRDAQDPDTVWVENYSEYHSAYSIRVSVCNKEGCFFTAAGRRSDSGKISYDAFAIDTEGNESSFSKVEAQETFDALNSSKVAAYVSASAAEESCQYIEDNVQ